MSAFSAFISFPHPRSDAELVAAAIENLRSVQECLEKDIEGGVRLELGNAEDKIRHLIRRATSRRLRAERYPA